MVVTMTMTMTMTLLLLMSAPAPGPSSQWIGLEAAPIWLHLYSRPDFEGKSALMNRRDARVALGGGGTVRLFRIGFQRAYWTPLQLGLGVGTPEVSAFAHASSEVGGPLPLLDGRLELGAALGAGIVWVTYGDGCDGDCYVGGGPVVFSPVVRFTLRPSPRLPLGIFARAVIPLGRPHDLASHYHGLATILMFGIDLAVTRP